MKILLLMLLSLQAYSQSRDCIHCSPGIYPLPNVPVPTWPLELIEIQKVDYRKNARVDFCKRPEEMLDTIVLHHSETVPTKSPQDINQYHLDRGWYMGGYSYVVNGAYPGASTPASAVTEGRPLDLVGSHAGSDVFVPMSDKQKELFNSGKVLCGKEGGEFDVDMNQIRGNTIKANVTTLGIVVIGNYVVYSRQNPAGYPRTKPRYITSQTQDMIARLSCQLQKKYPDIKSIKWHSYYHSTDCPGTIKQFVNEIKAQTRKYGCEFN